MKEVIVNAEDLVCLNKEKLQEIIRCKDCVHFKQSKVLGNTCALMDNHVTKKDYCSKAERKEE